MTATPPAPLAALLKRLQLGPPCLRASLDGIRYAESLRNLYALADAFTPDAAPVIRRGGGDAAVGLFLGAFQHAHFPLEEVEDGIEAWANYGLDERLPVTAFGFDCCDGPNPEEFRPGLRFLMALTDNDFLYTSRSELLAMVAGFYGAEVADRLEQDTMPDLPTIEVRVKSTPFAAVGSFLRWLAHDTGNGFLDVAAHHAFEEVIPWTPEDVAGLDRQWREARPLMEAVHHLTDWLETGPAAARASALLDVVLGAARRRRSTRKDIPTYGSTRIDTEDGPPGQPLLGGAWGLYHCLFDFAADLDPHGSPPDAA